MRNGPSSRSPQIVLLPEGALVAVVENTSTAEGKENPQSRWLYVRYGKTIGWVYAPYLWEGDYRSVVLEKRKIIRETHLTMKKIRADELTLTAIPSLKGVVYRAENIQETCFTDRCRLNETLYFKGRRVLYIKDIDCYHDRGSTRQYGSVEISGKKLIIKLERGKTITIGPNGKTASFVVQGRTMVLVFSGLLQGFIDDSILAGFGDSDIVLNRRGRYLATTKDEINRRLCEHGNRFSDNYQLHGYYTRSVLREHNPFLGRE